MKKSTISIALTSALLLMSAAHASEFKGGFVGIDIGKNNNSPVVNNSSSATYVGGQIGYGWDMGKVLLGVDGWYDAHKKSNTGNDAGVDAKLGYPMGNWMPYAKLGMAATTPANRVHGGLGVEYKFAPHWSVAGEWTYDRTDVNVLGVANGTTVQTTPTKFKNSNVSVGVNYYFDTPYVAPVIAAAVAPVVMKKVEPVVAPAPVVVAPAPKPVVVAPAPAPAPVVVAPAPKTIFTDKPITIEGASFATGSAKLKPAASKQLDVVVDFAAKNKESNLTVEGYTDNRGKEKANEALSAKRAEAVKAYLVKKGVDAKRISAVGKGSAKPVGDNKTEAGRAQNRRVEIDSVVRVAK